MCICTPEIRTPYCGKKGCEWPKDLGEPVPPSDKQYSVEIPKPTADEEIESIRICKEQFIKADQKRRWRLIQYLQQLNYDLDQAERK